MINHSITNKSHSFLAGQPKKDCQGGGNKDLFIQDSLFVRLDIQCLKQ